MVNMSFRWCAVGVGGAKLKCREKRQYSGLFIRYCCALAVCYAVSVLYSIQLILDLFSGIEQLWDCRRSGIFSLLAFSVRSVDEHLGIMCCGFCSVSLAVLQGRHVTRFC
ncbi:hypothetical protein T4D_5193 [Trichinella pseudospiralis]|uniref:Uncharacterized protein n=1 Tax=Trichinella pseudospiralis TaxID=6337 RepID=A0A0V1FI71_TRIPS|nr:hypothetical protein T4D_5193 [Trichinella pseudospiralis]